MKNAGLILIIALTLPQQASPIDAKPLANEIMPVPQSANIVEIIDGDSVNVQFYGEGEITHLVRLAGVSTPSADSKATCPDIATQAKKLLEPLKGRRIEVYLGPTGDRKHILFQTAIGNRLLGYVFSPESGNLVQKELVQSGFARIDVRKGELFLDKVDEEAKFLFSSYYVDTEGLIQEQVESVQKPYSWWQKCDPFKDSPLVIAAIQFWTDTQAVYITNKGQRPIDLCSYSLTDRQSYVLNFRELTQNCSLELKLNPSEKLEIHFDHHQTEPDLKNGKITIPTSKLIWNQGESGDTACLVIEGMEENCKRDAKPSVDNGLCYVYQYPPDDGEQTPSSEMQIDSRCFPSVPKAGSEKLN